VVTPKERYPQWRKWLILRSLLERVSLRGIERIFRVWRGTILRWLRQAMKPMPRLSQTRLPMQAGDVLELDETWSFVGEREDERGLWMAMCCDGWEAYQLTFPPDQLAVYVGERGPTNHMERWYNTLRQRLARYTRKTLSFSKSDHYHRLITHAFILHYSLAIQRLSLTLQP
jgi:insertion element IS1 protein InsB